MSHIATVNCQVKDLDAIEEAVKKFKATLVRGKTAFKAYYGDTNTKCNHVITLDNAPNGYSIGLRQKAQADEEFELACDFFDGSLEKVFGKKLVSLQNEYGCVVAEKTMRKAGHRVSRYLDTPEKIELRVIAR